MILTENIEEIISLALYSAYIKNEKPISLLLVASPEAGKTRVVQKFSSNQFLAYISDCTAYGLHRDYSDDLRHGLIKHFIFTDLITPLSKNVDTRSSFISFLNGLIEEGLMQIHTFNTNTDKAERIYKPVGIIGCIAPAPLNDHRHKWKSVGFMSRLIPFSWSYSETTIANIRKSIQYQEYHEDKPIELDLPKFELSDGTKQPDNKAEINVELNPELSAKLSDITDILAERKIRDMASGALIENKQDRKNTDNPYGFRLEKQLHVLAKSSALKDNRQAVNEKDIEKIIKLSNWMNLKFNEL
jgi:hypothetical protein